MTNRFAVVLHPESVQWAAAEGGSETVIAAVLLLHERSVEQIVTELGTLELEQVIKLVGRSPRVYPLGTLDALKQRRTSISPPRDNGPGDLAAKEAGRRRREDTCSPPCLCAGRHSPRSTVEGGNGAGPSQPAAAGAGPPQHAAADKTGPTDIKSGTGIGTRNETARRRLIVEELMKTGLSIRMIADMTDIPRSAVHRAMRAIARAEARKQVAIAEIAAELVGKKLSHRDRRWP